MSEAENARWYVVHTYSGYENKVKADIEKTKENRNLQDQIIEVVVHRICWIRSKKACSAHRGRTEQSVSDFR